MKIEPYYQKENITIYHGDCLEIMPQLEPVDLVLTDPPYGIAYNNKTDVVMVGDYSNVLGRALPCFHNCLNDKGAVYVFTSWKLLSDWLYRFEMYFKTNNLLIWEKESSSGLYSGSNFGFCYEMIFFGSKGRHKLLEPEFDVLGFRRISPKSKRHPTQKPHDLIKRLISVSCNSQNLILDPFMGSGTTLVAAKELGRKAIGIEIEEKYCEIAVDRLRQGVFSF
jgi:site-specific DNA-methyltransferase (adenine-specific)